MDLDLQRDLQRLRGQAATHVVRWPSREPIWTAVYKLTRGSIDRRPRHHWEVADVEQSVAGH
jgi:hypothetical protein